MSQPSYITALELKEPRREELSPEVQKYFAVCDEKIGLCRMFCVPIPSTRKSSNHSWRCMMS